MINFRDMALTSNTPNLSVNATCSVGRARRVTGGLGSRHWTSAYSIPTAVTHLLTLTNQLLSHVLNASVAKNCNCHMLYG